MPKRLLELYAALHYDPVLIQECLARPSFVSRLSRSFFAYDARIHAGARNEAEALRQRLAEGEFRPLADDPMRTETEVLRDDVEPMRLRSRGSEIRLASAYPKAWEEAP